MNEKERFIKIKNLVLHFEDGEISLEECISRINEIGIRPIVKYELLNYWRAEDLDNFVSKISADAIADWEEITDERALGMIEEVMDNPSKDGLLMKNSEALEKRYQKTEGTLIDLIFHKELNTPESVLKALKQDTTIYL